ncbi:DUF6923 family protein, partial [Belliella kenyensis]
AGLITWTIGDLADGANATLEITATVLATGDYGNTATINSTSEDPDLTNNQASVTVVPLVPFDCADNSALISLGPNINTGTTLFQINRVANPFVYVPIGNNSHGITYNAIGYNIQDNFLYGINQSGGSSNELVRVDANGTVINLGPISGLPVGNYISGDMDASGFLYVNVAGSISSIYKINVATRQMVEEIVLTLELNNVPDIAFNPVNGLLYGVIQGFGSTRGRLFSINPANGNVGLIGPAFTTAGTFTFGAMYGDSLGNIYGNGNDGGFFKFNLDDGSRVRISNSQASTVNDGAFCSTGIFNFDADPSLVKTVTSYIPGESVTFQIVVSNSGPFGVASLVVTDPIILGIPISNHTYTATVSGGASTQVLGTQTGAINDIVNLPIDGSVTYSYTVVIPPSFLGPLTNTASISVPLEINDINPGNNESTASVSIIRANSDSAGPINGLVGATNIGINVLDNDTFNAAAVVPANVTISPNTNGPLTVNADGTVSVASNTPAGTYNVNYTVCLNSNPSNCSTTTVTVTVIRLDANVGIEKTSSSATPNVGSNVVFTLTASNAGPSAAT